MSSFFVYKNSENMSSKYEVINQKCINGGRYKRSKDGAIKQK